MVKSYKMKQKQTKVNIAVRQIFFLQNNLLISKKRDTKNTENKSLHTFNKLQSDRYSLGIKTINRKKGVREERRRICRCCWLFLHMCEKLPRNDGAKNILETSFLSLSLTRSTSIVSELVSRKVKLTSY